MASVNRSSKRGKECADGCALSISWARETLQGRAEALLAQLEAVRSDSVEGVHDMRVASRRLRNALSEVGKWATKDARDAYQSRVKSITRALGRPRELDVMIGMISERMAAPSANATSHNLILEQLHARRTSCAEACRTAVEQGSCPAFLEELHQFRDALRPSKKCLLDHAAKRLTRQYKRLCGQFEEWKHFGEETHLHQLRIGFKKMRYTVEIYAPLYGKEMQQFQARLKKAQEILGDWQDHRVLIDEVCLIRQETADLSGPDCTKIIEALTKEKKKRFRGLDGNISRFFTKTAQKRAISLFHMPSAACCRVPKEDTPHLP